MSVLRKFAVNYSLLSIVLFYRLFYIVGNVSEKSMHTQSETREKNYHNEWETYFVTFCCWFYASTSSNRLYFDPLFMIISLLTIFFSPFGVFPNAIRFSLSLYLSLHFNSLQCSLSEIHGKIGIYISSECDRRLFIRLKSCALCH